MNGPESPEPSIGTNFAVGSGGFPAKDLDLRRSLSFTSRSPSCSSASFMSHSAFCRGRLRSVPGALRYVWLWRYFRSRRKRKLAGHHDGLIGFHASLNHSEITSLPLAGLYRAEIVGVI